MRNKPISVAVVFALFLVPSYPLYQWWTHPGPARTHSLAAPPQTDKAPSRETPPQQPRAPESKLVTPTPPRPPHPTEPAPPKAKPERKPETKTKRKQERKKETGPTIDELFLFHPTKHPHGDWQPECLTFEDVWFTSADDVRLHGWYCPHDDPQGVILYAHGNGGNLAGRAERVAHLRTHLRMSVLIFDYRGYGRSAGKPTVQGILHDTRAARSVLAKKAGIAEPDVILLGRSLGGAVTAHLAAETPPRALVLESTFTSFRDVAGVHRPRLSWLVPKAKLNSLKLIPDVDCPVFISHGDSDHLVPFSHGEQLFEAAEEPKRFLRIPETGHNDILPDEGLEELAEFFETLSDER